MAKQTQLVSQHLENISHEPLSKYQDVIRNYVRRRQALYRKNQLYYVGPVNPNRPFTDTNRVPDDL